MIRTDEAVLADLVASDDVAVAAALSEIRSSARPINGAVREVVDRIACTHPCASMRERAQAVIAVADASSRIDRVRKAWGATLNPLFVASILRNPVPAVRKKALETIRSCDPRPYGEVVARRLSEESEPALLVMMLEVVGRAQDRGLMRWVDPIVGCTDPSVSLAALDALLALAHAEMEPSLLARLEELATGHACPDVRFLARRSLAARRGGTVEGAAAVDPDHAALTPSSLTALLGHPSSDARLSALERAAEGRDRALAGPIAAALPAQKDARVLAHMVSALRDLGSEEHASAVKPLLSHPDDRVCANAVEALVRLSGHVAVETLLPLLARNDNRLKANLMLAMRDRYQLQVAGYVRRMLCSPKFSFRISGLYCARFMDLADIYPDVLCLVSDERNPEALRAGLSWLAEYGLPVRAAQDLDDLALLRPEAGAQINQAREQLGRRGSGEAPRTPDALFGATAGRPERAQNPEPAALPPLPKAPSGPTSQPTFPTAPRPLVPEHGRTPLPAPPLSGEWRVPPASVGRQPTPTRPGTRADPGAQPAERIDIYKWLSDPRVSAALATAALAVVFLAVTQLTGRDAPAVTASRARGHVKARPATPTPLRGVVTHLSGPPESLDVDLQVRKRTYTLRWPTSARPRVGETFHIGSLKVVQGPDGSERLTAGELTPAPGQ